MNAVPSATDSAGHSPAPQAAGDILGDYWPGIQIYYPPVKYAPSLGFFVALVQAAQRFR